VSVVELIGQLALSPLKAKDKLFDPCAITLPTLAVHTVPAGEPSAQLQTALDPAL